MKQIKIIINLIAVFVAAFALTTFLHELAHAITAKIAGVPSVLFHSYVSYNNTSTPATHQIYILANGPLFSFFQALIFLKLLQKRTANDFVSLFYLWMGIIGMVVFLGYIMMGPFMPYGDTGKIYAIFSTPSYISLSLAVLALIGIIIFFRKLTPTIANLLLLLKAKTELKDQNPLLPLFILPLVIGTLINIMISLPAPTLMSLAFPIVIPLTLIPSIIRLSKTSWTFDKKAPDEKAFSEQTYWPVVLMILLFIISRILALGVNI